MSSVLVQHFRSIQQEVEHFRPDAGRRLAADQIGEHIDVVAGLWEALKRYVDRGMTLDADRRRTALMLTRIAEQVMGSLRRQIETVEQSDIRIPGRGLLADAHEEAQIRLLMPLASLIAARDPEKRSAEEICNFLLARVEWQDGRPIISPELSEQLPCPYDPEPAAS